MFDLGDDIDDAPNKIDRVWAIFIHILLVSPSLITIWLVAKPFIKNSQSPQIAISIALFVSALAICHALTMPVTALKEELAPISIALILAIILMPVTERAQDSARKVREQQELKMDKTRAP